jgi:predicted kinase
MDTTNAPERPLELVIFVGLQATGKTTFFRERFAATHAHVSKDLLRRGKNRQARQEARIVAALEAGQSVVVDNTNPTVADRAALIAIGRRFGARIVGCYFTSPFAASLARNRQRTGKARVPDVGLYATRARLQPPTHDEGFDALFNVQLVEGDGFAVRALQRHRAEAAAPQVP